MENELADMGMPVIKIINANCQLGPPIIILLCCACLGLLLGSVPGKGRNIGTESDGELLCGFS